MRRKWLILTLTAAFAACGWARAYYLSSESRRRAVCEALDSDDLERLQYALPYLAAAAELEPWASLASGKLLLAARMPAAAIERLEIAAAREETRTRASVLIGEGWYRQGELLKAGAIWTRALETDPDNIEANRWLAVAYYDLGAKIPALNYLREVARLAPQDPRPYRVMGLIHGTFGRTSEAVDAYQEALRLGLPKPDEVAVRLELAEALHLQEHDTEALAVLEPAPSAPDVLVQRAECNVGLGRTEQALKLAQEAVSLEGDHVKSLLKYGELLLSKQNPSLAAKYLERAFKLSPGNRDVLASYLSAVQKCPDREAELQQLQERLREATKLQDVSRRLTEQASDNPSDAALRIQLALISERLGQIEDAKLWYQAALFLDPKNQALTRALSRLRGAEPPFDLSLDAVR